MTRCPAKGWLNIAYFPREDQFSPSTRFLAGAGNLDTFRSTRWLLRHVQPVDTFPFGCGIELRAIRRQR